MSYAFLPIDLPKLPYSEEYYWEFFNKHNAEKEYWDMFEKNHSSGSTKIWDFYLMRDANLTEEERNCIAGGPEASKYNDHEWWWHDAVLEELPELVKLIEDLPLRNITHTSMLCNIQSVGLHQDLDPWSFAVKGVKEFTQEVRDLKLEPCHYKMLLAGNRTSSYVSETNDEEKAVRCIIPDETDTFLFDASNYWHGGYSCNPLKLLCIISGWIDPEPHRELLAKSIEKYSNYGIYYDPRELPMSIFEKQARG